MPPMAWGALSLAIVSFLFIGLGVLFTPVPGVGAAFAFTAPLLALAGIILGGRAVTKSKAAALPSAGGTAAVPSGEASGLALAAVIASALAFVPAVLTALTCGACNALCASGQIQSQQRFNTSTGTIDPFDLLRKSGALGPLDGDAGVALPDQPERDAGTATGAEALPPPPLAPGPKP